MAAQFTTYRTTLGWAGLAWDDGGIVRAGLAEPDRERVRRAMRRRLPGAFEASPTAEIAAAAQAIAGLFDGQPGDLTSLRLDMDGVQPFDRAVYAAARAIAPGETATYGELAARIGAPRQARDVGTARARNPFAPVVPCHRVVAADGGLGGFSAPGGVETKRRLLALEGALAPTLFDAA